MHFVYNDSIISTIVDDGRYKPPRTGVYNDSIISTIVDHTTELSALHGL